MAIRHFFVTFLLVVFSDSPITTEISPKFAIENPYKSQTFRVVVRIPEHPDNRILSLSGDCGSDAYATQRAIDARVFERLISLKVVHDCLFVACVHRAGTKVQTFCDTTEVPIPEDP